MDVVFLSFLLSVMVINLSPGPAMMFVLQQSQRNGTSVGISAAFGVELGVFIYVILTVLGIGIVFERFPDIYTGIQLIGAIYLLYLAYASWPRANKSVSATVTGSQKTLYTQAFIKGLFINLTNPKIVLFFLSLIPQFVPADSDVTIFILYGIIFNIGGVLVNFSVAVSSGYVAKLLQSVRWFDYATSILFIAIATYSIWNIYF